MKQRLEWDVDAWRRAHEAEGAVKAEPSGRAGMCRAGPAGVRWNPHGGPRGSSLWSKRKSVRGQVV